jgi:SSS family solute:Na+ symporter
MAVSVNFAAQYPLQIGGTTLTGYTALYAVILNVVVSVVLTWVFRAASAPAGADETGELDYTAVAA